METRMVVVSIALMFLFGGVSTGPTEIHSMDYFIELVEKIERHPSVGGRRNIRDVANFIRKLEFDDDMWTLLLGKSFQELPHNVLARDELQSLREMMPHRFENFQERGVLLSDQGNTVAIGRVILGICAGLARDETLVIDAAKAESERVVDNLFAATVARDIVHGALLAEGGLCASPFGSTLGFWAPTEHCPAQYVLNTDGCRVSVAVLLGDIDGFLLGTQVSQWAKRGARLGQLLKMYYRSGVAYDRSFSGCNRFKKFKTVVTSDKLKEEVVAFASVSRSFSGLTGVSPSNVPPSRIRNKAVKATNQFFDIYLGCKRPANVVFIMDESGSIEFPNYEKEKHFVMQIIEAFDVSRFETRVAVVEYSSYARVSFQLDKYGSKTRLLCAVQNLRYTGGHTFTGEAIRLVQNYVLGPQQWIYSIEGNDAPVQLLVVLTDGRSTDARNLKAAVKDIKSDIRGLTIIAIGIGDTYDRGELELIATDPSRHVFTSANFDELVQLVGELRNRTCTEPGNLWIDFHTGANQTSITAVVSPGKVRYFTLEYELFAGLKNVQLEIIPLYGTVEIFASRSIPNPGLGDHDVHLPPRGYGNSSDTCPPLHLAIYGRYSSLGCTDLDCNLPNQIKFTILKGSPDTVLPSNRGRHHSAQATLYLPPCLVALMVSINFWF